MQLTKLSDHALRLLMHAPAAGDRRVTIEEMATPPDLAGSPDEGDLYADLRST